MREERECYFKNGMENPRLFNTNMTKDYVPKIYQITTRNINSLIY